MTLNNSSRIERRKGPDIWMKIVSWASIAGWIVLFAIIYILSKAKPQTENFFDKMLNVRLRKTWDIDLAQYAFYLMIFLLIFSFSTFIINIKRHKRKTDRYSPSIILMFIFSVMGIISYIAFL
jgi:formate hydrogenlyase subunit 3/multisubunit Na+/H+ antiporter MnhD subunit